MTDTSEKIFELLRRAAEPIPRDELAKQLGLQSDRQLRSQQRGEEGILDRAAREIFETHGLVLLVGLGGKRSGIWLSRDIENVRVVREKWRHWFWALKHRVDFYDDCIEKLQNEEKQLRLL